MVVVCDFPPPAPVTVMVWLPVLAPAATLMVIVDVPEPDVMAVGAKLTVTPDGRPEANKETVELKPPVPVVVIVEVPEPVQATLSEVGDALIVKLPALPEAVTVRVTVVVCVRPPPVPVTVI